MLLQFILDQLKESGEKLESKAEDLTRAWSNLLVAFLKKRRTLLDEKCVADLTLSYLESVLHKLADSEENANVALTSQVLLHLLNTASR